MAVDLVVDSVDQLLLNLMELLQYHLAATELHPLEDLQDMAVSVDQLHLKAMELHQPHLAHTALHLPVDLVVVILLADSEVATHQADSVVVLAAAILQEDLEDTHLVHLKATVLHQLHHPVMVLQLLLVLMALLPVEVIHLVDSAVDLEVAIHLPLVDRPALEVALEKHPQPAICLHQPVMVLQ